MLLPQFRWDHSNRIAHGNLVQNASPANKMAFGWWDQGHKLFDELRKGKEQVCGAITLGGFELQLDRPIGNYFEPFIRQWASCNIFDQLCQPVSC